MQGRSIVGLSIAAALVIAVPRVAPAGIGMTTFAAGHQGADGKAIYADHCKECHGVIGVPTKAAQRKYDDKVPNFREPAFLKSKTDAELLDAIAKGKGRDMKGWSDKLTPDEIKAVLAYVRTLPKPN